MICGQLEKVRLTFVNLNDQASISNLRIASNRLKSNHLCFHETDKSTINNNPYDNTWFEKEYSCLSREEVAASQMNNAGDEAAQADQLPSVAETMINKMSGNKKIGRSDLVYSIDNVTIKPADHYSIDMWIKAPEAEGEHKFYLMFFYEEYNPDKPANKHAANKNMR